MSPPSAPPAPSDPPSPADDSTGARPRRPGGTGEPRDPGEVDSPYADVAALKAKLLAEQTASLAAGFGINPDGAAAAIPGGLGVEPEAPGEAGTLVLYDSQRDNVDEEEEVLDQPLTVRGCLRYSSSSNISSDRSTRYALAAQNDDTVADDDDDEILLVPERRRQEENAISSFIAPNAVRDRSNFLHILSVGAFFAVPVVQLMLAHRRCDNPIDQSEFYPSMVTSHLRVLIGCKGP